MINDFEIPTLIVSKFDLYSVKRMLIVLTNKIQNKRWEEQWAYGVWLIDSWIQWQNLA